jgi:hypothetical protein
VRQPEGNGVAERFIRTLEENLLWVRSFQTIEDPRLALLEFADSYQHPLAGRPSWPPHPGSGQPTSRAS